MVSLPRLKVVMLGAFRVHVDGESVEETAWRRRKARQLFKLLITRSDRRLLKDEAIELLWPESEPTAASINLRTTVRALRLALGSRGSQLIVETAEAYGLHANAEVWTDVNAFESLLAQAAAAADPLPLLEQAHALYGGDYLPDDLYEDFASAQREHLKRTWLELQHALTRQWQLHHDHERALLALERLVRADPCDERAVQELMQLLGRLGRRPEALRVYQRMVEALRADLDVEPSAAIRQLYIDLSSASSAEPAPHLPTGTLTFLFTDVEGSSRAWLRDPARMSDAVARHDALIEQQVTEHGGQVVRPRGEGDSRFAVFERASDAVAAASAIETALLHEPWKLSEPVRVRVAVHTGEADLRSGDYYGPAVNHCARLRAVAHGGQVLVSAVTADLVRESLSAGLSLRDLGEHQLKDLDRPERIWQLLHPELPGDFPPLMSVRLPRHNLPHQLSSFVGREQQIVELGDLLGRTRLLTLTGLGGIGKTRLATQLAAALIGNYSDGVWLVRLDAFADPSLVPTAIASVLGVREQPGRSLLEVLADAVGSRDLLLVLDNCEHLIRPCAECAEALLEACPRLHLLVTSRSPLRLRGERVVVVPPLSLPNADLDSSPALAGRAEAVMLFVERAQTVWPGFMLTPANAAVVTEICRRVDGLPLAIELAAARMRMLPPKALLDQLGKGLNVLVGGPRDLPMRQQTLRATLDWSHSLLAAGQQALFRRLSVFVGGFSLEAAQAVCDPEHDLPFEILDGLEELVDQSMVHQEVLSEDVVRFRLLETVREYALERLVESGEAGRLGQQHARYFLSLAETAEPQLQGPGQAAWLERLEQEHDNLRAALRCCVAQGEVEQSLRLGAALWRFWHIHGHLTEGREGLAAVLELGGTQMRDGPRAAAHAGALNGAGVLALRQGDYAAARSLLEESLAIRRDLGDRREIANSLGNLGMVATEQGDGVLARSLHQESLAIRRELGDRWGIAMSLQNLGEEARRQGDYELARCLLEEGLAIRRELGDQRGIAMSLLSLGVLAHDQGDYVLARSLLEASLAMSRQLRDAQGIAVSLDNLGKVAQVRGDYVLARSLHQESLAIRREQRDRRGIAVSLTNLGVVAQHQGDYALAQSLHQESLALAQELGDRRLTTFALESVAGAAANQGQPARVYQHTDVSYRAAAAPAQASAGPAVGG